jgi:hypothetical protein
MEPTKTTSFVFYFYHNDFKFSSRLSYWHMRRRRELLRLMSNKNKRSHQLISQWKCMVFCLLKKSFANSIQLFTVSSQRRLGLTCWNLCHDIGWVKLCHKLGTADSPGLPNPFSTIMATSHLSTFISLGQTIDWFNTTICQYQKMSQTFCLLIWGLQFALNKSGLKNGWLYLNKVK